MQKVRAITEAIDAALARHPEAGTATVEDHNAAQVVVVFDGEAAVIAEYSIADCLRWARADRVRRYLP